MTSLQLTAEVRPSDVSASDANAITWTAVGGNAEYVNLSNATNSKTVSISRSDKWVDGDAARDVEIVASFSGTSTNTVAPVSRWILVEPGEVIPTLSINGSDAIEDNTLSADQLSMDLTATLTPADSTLEFVWATIQDDNANYVTLTNTDRATVSIARNEEYWAETGMQAPVDVRLQVGIKDNNKIVPVTRLIRVEYRAEPEIDASLIIGFTPKGSGEINSGAGNEILDVPSGQEGLMRLKLSVNGSENQTEYYITNYNVIVLDGDDEDVTFMIFGDDLQWDTDDNSVGYQFNTSNIFRITVSADLMKYNDVAQDEEDVFVGL